jgi:hypothetical protein
MARLISSLIFSALWAYYGAKLASSISLDYVPIIETFDDIRLVEDFFSRFQYALFGNSTLVFIYDAILPSLESEIITFILYYTASFVRSIVTIYLVGFGRAILLLFAYEWVFDFNQSRLSLAMSFLFLGYFFKKNYLIIFSVAAHLAILPFSLYLNINRRLRAVFIIFFFLSVFFIMPMYFPRYFLNDFKDPYPLNTLIYGFFIIVIGIVLAREKTAMPELYYFIAMLITFVALRQIGFSAVYLGRIAEMVCYFAITRLGFMLESKAISNYRSLQINAVYVAITLLIFSYQTITIFGNVWRFFD